MNIFVVLETCVELKKAKKKKPESSNIKRYSVNIYRCSLILSARSFILFTQYKHNADNNLVQPLCFSNKLFLTTYDFLVCT